MNQGTQPQPTSQQPAQPAPPAYPPQAPAGYAPPVQPAGYGQAPAPTRKGASCWLIGCIVVLVLTLLGAVGGYFGLQYVKAKIGPTAQGMTLPELLNPDNWNATPSNPNTSGSGGMTQPPSGNQGGGNQGSSGGGQSSSGSNTPVVTPPPVTPPVTPPSNTGGGQSSSGGGAAAVPSPMGALNAFLKAAGNGDGSGMAGFMTGQARSDFGQLAEMWGQGDYDHKAWTIDSQQKISDAKWHYEVTETHSDWETGAPFYSSYGIDLQWNGSVWQVSDFGS